MKSNKFKIRLVIGLAIVAFAFIKRCNSKEINPYTQREQTINMSSDQEIAIGLESAPQMAQQHGGLHPTKSIKLL